jgi:hypothetical protein
MATKKNNKKAMKSKAASGKQVAVGRHAPKKNTPKKLATMKKRKTSAKKKIIAATAKASGKTTRRDRQPETAALAQETVGLRSGEQSGDLQGLRDVESADSESVGELLEEGNAFEAGVVTGVEDAEDDEESEVRTHEVPEDDVPGEYDDKD